MERTGRRQQRRRALLRHPGRLTPAGSGAYITAAGRMAEWLCSGLQIRVQRFDSASGLHDNSYYLQIGFPRHRYPRRLCLHVLAPGDQPERWTVLDFVLPITPDTIA